MSSIVKPQMIIPTKKLTEKSLEKAQHASNSTLPDENSSFVQKSITDLPPVLISEIFNYLDPKELGIVSCVSTILHTVASEHSIWKDFYCQRWGNPIIYKNDKKLWRELFVEKEYRAKTFMGRYSLETLYGHTQPVRSIYILASANLMFTSGYDGIVLMWSVEEGLSVGLTRPLGCTIRAVSADSKLLVVGGTDGFIHCWKSVEGLPHLFDLKDENTEFRLWEHEGPITCLTLDLARIYSGSWDMTVRIWDRTLMSSVAILSHDDWVWGLAPHDTTVATASGSDLYVWDMNSKTPVFVIRNAHVGNANALSRSHTGHLLFSGGDDGAIHMFEITNTRVSAVATWIPHTGPVYSLAFDYPWLVSSSADGNLSLMDVRGLMKFAQRYSVKRLPRSDDVGNGHVRPPQRMFHGSGCNLFAVGIGVDRIVCSGDGGIVKFWNFSKALEVDDRARVLKGIRLENRTRRRRLQMEMNGKSCRSDQCSVAVAKKNMMNVDSGGGQHGKRVVNRKLKV